MLPTPNLATLEAAAARLRDAGVAEVRVNAPGANSAALFALLAERGATQVEPGHALTGTTLAGLAPFASKLLFPRGLAMFPKGMINGYFDPHDQGMGSKLTAAPIKPDTDHFSTGPSLDWQIASMFNTGTKSPLVLSVGSSLANVKGILSYKPGASAGDLPTCSSRRSSRWLPSRRRLMLSWRSPRAATSGRGGRGSPSVPGVAHWTNQRATASGRPRALRVPK